MTLAPNGPQVLEGILLPGAKRNPNQLAGRITLYDPDGNPIDLAAGSQGPVGPQGPIGPVGPVGPIGPNGAVGAQGTAGSAGPKGDTGSQGMKGDKGDKGDQGIKGDTGVGVAGPQGPAGAAGTAGAQGPAGAAGPKGDTGAQGLQGLQGPQGVQGVKGDTGPQGSVGATGAAGPTGPQGPAGVEGPKGDTGDDAILWRNKIWCTAGTYRASSFAGTTAYHVLEITATMGAPSLQLIIPPQAVDFEFECAHQNCLIRKDDAAYHYIYAGLRLSPADEDGITTALMVTTQHSQVDNYMGVRSARSFRCKAGTQYVIQAIMGGGNGGTWNYVKTTDTFLEAKALRL